MLEPNYVELVTFTVLEISSKLGMRQALNDAVISLN